MIRRISNVFLNFAANPRLKIYLGSKTYLIWKIITFLLKREWTGCEAHVLLSNVRPPTVFGILGCYVLAYSSANLPSELLSLSWLGAILSSLVTPFGALAFAACGRELARGCPPTLFSCFGEGWNDMETRNKLVLLGLIYGLCVIVIGLIVSLLTSGDIAQWKNAQGQIDPQSVLSHIPWLGFIVGAVLYACCWASHASLRC